MQRKSTTGSRLVLGLLVTFLAGLGAGVALGKDLPSTLYRGVSAPEAAENLLARAVNEIGKGSWENLAVARVYYLSGAQERGEALIANVEGRKMEKSDWMRIGRIYREAGEWERAEEAFARALEKAPKDDDLLGEVGAYYNLRGDRERAEELFDRAFAEEADDFWVMVEVAGSYLGVEPQ